MSLRNVDDAINKIISGAITGGVLAFRAGPRIAFKNSLIGGIFLGAIVLFEFLMVKKQKREMLEMQQEMYDKHMK